MRATQNDDLLYELPMLALRGLVLFPDMMLHFDVGRKKSIEALNAAMADEQRIFLVSQQDIRVDDPSENQLYKVGVVAKIRQILRMPNDNVRVLVEGLSRPGAAGSSAAAPSSLRRWRSFPTAAPRMRYMPRR